MAETDEKTDRLVVEITGHESVKGAAILDETGKITRLEGHAKVFRNGDPVDAPDDDEGSSHEDVFIESVGEQYLVVVFEARLEFDPIKERVDELLEELGL